MTMADKLPGAGTPPGRMRLSDWWPAWRNRIIRNPGFQRWAASFPLTRPFVRKHYSKLGNFLHAPTIGQLRQGRQKTTEDLRKYLEEILPQVERLCASTLQANLGAFSNLECECCGTTIVRNVKSLAVGGLVTGVLRIWRRMALCVIGVIFDVIHGTRLSME